jgi:anti-anti-sigma factor
MGAPTLTIVETDEGWSRVLTLRGELDLATAPELERSVAAVHAGDQLVLDFGDVTFVDSSGLRSLVLVAKMRQRSNQPKVLIRGPSTAVRGVLDMTGVVALFRIVD